MIENPPTSPDSADDSQKPEVDSSPSDLARAIRALTSVLEPKTADSPHLIIGALAQLGSLLTVASAIGLIGKAFGITDAQSATVSIFLVLALYIVIYRDRIQVAFRSHIILLFLISVGCAMSFFHDQIQSMLVSHTLSSTTGIVAYTPKANDFLPKLADYINSSRQEIWFTGISFYQSLPQHRDRLIQKFDEGVDVRFLVYDPRSSNLKEVAAGFSQTPEELRGECSVTLANLQSMHVEWKRRKSRGNFEVRLFSTIPKTRMYVFDRKSESGYTYFIPHVDQQNSPNVPGFLVRNIKTGVAPAYFEGIERLWNRSQRLEDWMGSPSPSSVPP